MDEKIHLLEREAKKSITHNLVNEGNNKLQDLFENFDPTVYHLGWYTSLKKYSEIMQRLKDEIASNKIVNYLELNERLNALAETSNEDFLETYLFSSEGKLATISQQLIEHVNREKIRLQINSDFNLLADVITSNDKREASKLIHVIANQNAWSVLRRFIRALFPAEFTSIDAENHFAVLKKVLKADFNIKLQSKDPFDRQKEVLALVNYQDIYKAQMFFWALKSGHLKSDRLEEPQLSYNTSTPAMKHPLNQILFGPPGTGKTYNTINRALEIINDKEVHALDWHNRSAVKELFDKKVDAGQIMFTTFHQSMSYEDFIEGIKPEEPELGEEGVRYRVLDGIFKIIRNKAALDMIASGPSTVAVKTISFLEEYDKLIEEIDESQSNGKDFTFTLRNGGIIKVDSVSQNDNISIKHNAEARSYIVSKARISRLYNELEDFNSVSNINKTYRDIIGGHNSSAYWAVMNVIHDRIKNQHVSAKNVQDIKDIDQKEILQNVKLKDFKERTGKPHILIIDEINRGNVSAIFGELITLLEDSKRAGRDEALEVILPYSKQRFSVPSNLYIIGTMNTADRSVEALDTALRRRFSFTEMMPKPDLIRTDGVLKNSDGCLCLEDEKTIINLVEILTLINKRIVALLDKDHQIGHSYLINVKTLKDLADAFKNCIIPLLQEYFYHDDEKIALVLGEGFVKPHPEDVEDNADLFPSLNSNIRLPSVRPNYKITPVSEDNILEAIRKMQ